MWNLTELQCMHGSDVIPTLPMTESANRDPEAGCLRPGKELEDATLLKLR